MEPLSLVRGRYISGSSPSIQVEFSDDISTGDSDKTKIVNSLIAKNSVSGGTDVVIDIFKNQTLMVMEQKQTKQVRLI